MVAALEMVAGVAEAGLPPAHVGLHAGPVIFQEGDYYGQTVNVASRIAEYARPGEVLVSQEVVDAASPSDVAFREIGPVELKGVGGAMRLHAAFRSGECGGLPQSAAQERQPSVPDLRGGPSEPDEVRLGIDLDELVVRSQRREPRGVCRRHRPVVRAAQDQRRLEDRRVGRAVVGRGRMRSRDPTRVNGTRPGSGRASPHPCRGRPAPH